MEELGLGFSAGFKFDPDDDELVEYYLLPKILRQQLPLEGVIIDDDPLSMPPWKLLPKHKRKDEAFFFANGEKKHDNGSRQRRTLVDGGCWQGQKFVVDGDKLPVSGGSGTEMITWKKYLLNFHLHGTKGSTGWVMHEYSISAPDNLVSSQRLYRIRFSGHGQSAKRVPDDYDGGAQAIAEPDLLEERIFAANSVVFPTMAAVDLVGDEDARPAETTYSDQGYQYQRQLVTATHDWNQMDCFQDLSVPYNGADVGDYARAESDLPEEHISAANWTVFPTVAVVDLVDDEDARQAATSTSDQDYQHQWTNSTCQMDSFQDLAAPDSMFFPGADVGDYGGPDLGTHGAGPLCDQGAPAGVMSEYDGAAPEAGMMLPFGQGSFSAGGTDESSMDFEPSDMHFTLDELHAFLDEARLHDQYSSAAGMQTQSSMQLMPPQAYDGMIG
jgi:hypothetical protein